MLAQSLSPILVQWRQLELTQKAIERWDGKRPTVESAGSGLTPFSYNADAAAEGFEGLTRLKAGTISC